MKCIWTNMKCIGTALKVPYFFGYKSEFFSIRNNPNNLDPSYKTDLDLWDCLGRINSYYSNISYD